MRISKRCRTRLLIVVTYCEILLAMTFDHNSVLVTPLCAATSQQKEHVPLKKDDLGSSIGSVVRVGYLTELIA